MSKPEDSTRDSLSDLSRRSAAYSRWFRARRPKKISNVVAQVMQRRGYAQIENARQLQQAWQSVAGEGVARSTRVGRVRRRTLEVLVVSSLMMQELTFQKQKLLTAMQRELPDAQIEKLRFRVGKID